MRYYDNSLYSSANARENDRLCLMPAGGRGGVLKLQLLHGEQWCSDDTLQPIDVLMKTYSVSVSLCVFVCVAICKRSP